jgi:hypothetical protein
MFVSVGKEWAVVDVSTVSPLEAEAGSFSIPWQNSSRAGPKNMVPRNS